MRRRCRRSRPSRKAATNIRTARPRWSSRSSRLPRAGASPCAAPGSTGRRALAVAPLPADFGAQLAANREQFPRGDRLHLRRRGLPRGTAALRAPDGGLSDVCRRQRRRAGDRERPPAARSCARGATRPCPEIATEQIEEQLGLAVDRVMAEGSLYDPRTRRARHQAGARRHDRGDLPRPRLPHHPAALRRCPSRSTRRPWLSRRRISATFKDLPGGQVLGPTFDYTHRLIDFALADEASLSDPAEAAADGEAPMPRVTDLLGDEGLIERERAARRRAGRRPHARAARLSRRARPAPASAGPRRRRLSPCPRLLDPARLSAARILSSARSASARSRWSSSPRSSASPCRSARSR